VLVSDFCTELRIVFAFIRVRILKRISVVYEWCSVSSLFAVTSHAGYETDDNHIDQLIWGMGGS